MILLGFRVIANSKPRVRRRQTRLVKRHNFCRAIKVNAVFEKSIIIPASMKALRTLRHACLLPVTGVLILCLHPVAARAASTPESQVESRLGGGTILNSSADKLIQAVGDSAKQTPQRAGGIVTAALAGGRADSDAIAPRVTVAAIEGL